VLIPLLYVAARVVPRWDIATLINGVGSAFLVTWAAAIRQVANDHPLVSYGDWSYGLYLVHVPMIAIGFWFVKAMGVEFASIEWLLAIGLTALVVGLAYGYCEAAAYRWMHRKWVRRGKLVPAAAEPFARAA
jgi:peptidoglycan/LPS O-acetylase OafA/YrhL